VEANASAHNSRIRSSRRRDRKLQEMKLPSKDRELRISSDRT
jgi:hypothetical protein